MLTVAPVRSQVIILVSSFEPQFLPENDQPHSCRILRSIADLLKVPVHLVALDGLQVDDHPDDPFCSSAQSNSFFFVDSERSVLSNMDLLDTMKRLDRDQLFVCGQHLDDVVAATALSALALGFNVHTIVGSGCSPSREPSLRDDRLNQYGVVPITLRSLIYEWMTNTEDDVKKRHLHDQWKQLCAADGR